MKESPLCVTRIKGFNSQEALRTVCLMYSKTTLDV